MGAVIRALLAARAPARCSSCRYWREDGPASAPGAGTCRAELPRVVTYSAPPPVVMHGRRNGAEPAQLQVQSYWPPVSEQEWCGRFRRRWSL